MVNRAPIWLCVLLAACAGPSDDPATGPLGGATTGARSGTRALVPGQPDMGLVVDESPGLWHPHRDSEPGEVELREAEALGTLPYLAGTQEAAAAGGSQGVSRHQPDAAWQSHNLVVSGHTAGAFLIDMDGEVMHHWSRAYSEITPPQPPTGSVMEQFWRRAHLYPNGDVLALFENIGLLKVDRDSRQIWYYPGRAHHDFEVLPDGTIYVLTQRPSRLEFRGLERDILDNYVTVLDAKGRELRSISIVQSLLESEYRITLFQMFFNPLPDVLHVNTLRVLDGSAATEIPAFRQGNLLISSKNLNFVAVLDPEQERVVWAMFNFWGGQHDPALLPGGNILLFDNYGIEDRSRVLEFDPGSQQIEWSYDGTPERPLYSKTCGLVQRLPNGNTLITETNAGRALEIRPDGGLVWEFLSPFRAGENGELIASLFQLTRLDPSIDPTAW